MGNWAILFFFGFVSIVIGIYAQQPFYSKSMIKGEKNYDLDR